MVTLGGVLFLMSRVALYALSPCSFRGWNRRCVMSWRTPSRHSRGYEPRPNTLSGKLPETPCLKPAVAGKCFTGLAVDLSGSICNRRRGSKVDF